MSLAEPGTVWLGRYRLIRRLGTGGSAVVWEAEDQILGRRVAIKRLHMPSDAGSRRFMREARLGALMRHPGLVTVLDVVEGDETLQLVMELVEGGSLADKLASGPLDPDTALPILRSIAEALDHAHAHGIVHRDVKPDNILIGRDGRARLADLGIAQAAESTRLTVPGAVLGTPAFLAPEVLEGGRATPAADVYALAAVAFEMLSGRRARFGRSSAELVRRIVYEPPPDLRQAWPDAPEAVAEAIRCAMCRDPAERPASATAFVEALEAAFGVAVPRAASAPPDAAARKREPVSDASEAPTSRVPAAPGAAAAGAAAGAGKAPTLPGPPLAERQPPTLPGPPPAHREAAETPPRRSGGQRGAPAQPARGRGRAAPRLAALIAISAVVTAVVLIVLLGRTADEPRDERAASAPTATATQESAAAPESTATPRSTATPERTATPRATRAPAPAGATPRSAVQGFYERAAAGDFDGAWALAGPGFRAAFGDSQAEFERQLSSLESIEFEQVGVSDRTDTSATVTITTVATHADRVDRCAGPLRTTRAGDGWVVDPGGVQCQSTPR